MSSMTSHGDAPDLINRQRACPETTPVLERLHSQVPMLTRKDFGETVLLANSFAVVLVAVGAMAWLVWSMAPSGSRAAAQPPLDLIAYARGAKLYASTCVACHGAQGTGVAHLGKDLVHSRFVQSSGDGRLVEFIDQGRGVADPLNTTGVAMPPKGGNPELSDKSIAEIVVYLRGLQQPARVPPGEAPAGALADLMPPPEPVEAVAATPPPAPPAMNVPQTAKCGSSIALATSSPLHLQAIARGKKVYTSCMACHGRDATGMKGMGKDLAHSSFVARLNDEELLAFLKRGRGPSDPDNTTKVAMPPKGGNPALGDKQLRDLIVYLRSLQHGAQPATASPIASAAPSAPPAAANPAPQAATASPAAPSASPVAAATPLDAEANVRGKKVFSTCMACHGREGPDPQRLRWPPE